MPGAPMPGAPPTPPQGQPPIGSSPATGPTQNVGMQAQGLQAAAALLELMASILPKVGVATPLGMAINKAIGDIGKTIPPGAASPQGKANAVDMMKMKQMQMAPQMAALQASQHQPPGAGGGSPMPGGPPPGQPQG